MTLLQQTAWNLVKDLKNEVKKFNLLVKKTQVKMSLVMTLKVVVRCNRVMTLAAILMTSPTW
jgi:hypothetical protein